MRAAPLLAILTALTPSCLVQAPAPESPTPPALIGLNGRRLLNDDVYRVPLDRASPSPLWEPVREAMAIRNEGAATVVLEDLFVRPLGDTLPGELAVVRPERTRTEPLDVGGARLAPGDQLDFDVRLLPQASGVRAAELVLRWEGAAERVIELRGRGEGELRLRQPGPALGARWTAPRRPDAERTTAITHASCGWVAATGAGRAILTRVDASDVVTSARGLGALPRSPATACAGPGGATLAATGSSEELGRPGIFAARVGHDGELAWARAWTADMPLPAVSACAQDGRQLAVAAGAWVLVVPERGGDARAYELRVAGAPLAEIGALALAPDGRTIAIGRRADLVGGGALVIWSEDGGSPIGLALPWAPTAAAVDGDGTVYVAGGDALVAVSAGKARWAVALGGLRQVEALLPTSDGLFAVGPCDAGACLAHLEARSGALLDGLVWRGPAPLEARWLDLALGAGGLRIALLGAPDAASLANVYAWRPEIAAIPAPAPLELSIEGRDAVPVAAPPIPDVWDGRRDVATGAVDGSGPPRAVISATLRWDR